MFSTVFSYFVDFTKWILATFTFSGYVGQLVMLAINVFLMGMGLVFYLSVAAPKATAQA